MVVCDFLYCWEVLLCRVEVVDCYLVHSDVHYRAVTSVAVVPVEVRLAYLRRSATLTAANSDDASTMFLLHLFVGLEYGRQQALILHERTIMVVFTNVTHATIHRAGHIVFKVTIESLVLAVVNFEVSKISAAVLGGQRALLHINIMILLFLLGVNVGRATDPNTARANVVAILIIKGAIRHIVRDLAHAF